MSPRHPRDERDTGVTALAQSLGHDFGRPDLLTEALTHPSVEPEDRGTARHGYQRLEFLGDRVLGLLIAEWLFERFGSEAEGALARRYSALVRAETLAEVAHAIGLGRFLRLSAAELEQGGRDKAAILADACEAVIAALYLDGGLDAARRFVRREWQDLIERDIRPPKDPKTALQEWAQARHLPLPRYDVVTRVGADHAPVFEVQVAIDGYPPTTGRASSKRGAEREAAERLFATLPKS